MRRRRQLFGVRGGATVIVSGAKVTKGGAAFAKLEMTCACRRKI